MTDETKSGNRNNTDDRARIRTVRQKAREIDALTLELEPNDEDSPEQQLLDTIVTNKAMRFKVLTAPAGERPPITPEATKSLKAYEDYIDPGYRVLGVPFGGPVKGRDAQGEAFHEATDIWLKAGDEINLTYYHGFGPDAMDSWQEPPVLIGRAKYAGADERGHWFEPRLDTNEPLAQRVMDGSNVKASSGAVSHLVRMGTGGLIDVWPVGELALFDVNDWRRPANDYAITESKSGEITEPQDTVKADDAKTVPEQSDEPVTDNPTIDNPVIDPLEGKEMDEKIETAAVDSVADELKSLRAEIEALKAQPGVEKGAPTAKAVTKDPRHSASFGKAMAAWAKGDNPAGFSKGIEMTMYPEAAKGAWEGGTDNEGGYTVPDDFYNGVVEQRDLLSWVRQAPVQKFVVNHDRILIPTESTAGTKLVVTDEEAGYDENEPVFGQVALTIYKFTKMLKISEELMDGDGVGLEKYLASTLARAQAKAENYYLTVGTGSSMPQGLVYGSTSSSVMMASPDAIVSTDLSGARGVLNAGWDNPGEVGAIMAPSVAWYIKGITGSPFQFINTPAGTGTSLFGEPVFLAPDCDALTVHSGKVVTWFNFNAYAFAERQGLTVARNPYLYQANGIMGIFAKARFGGAILQALGTVHMLGHND